MLMVIFGAGASYDSDPRFRPGFPQDHWAGVRFIGRQEISGKRPPLAAELFDDRFNEIVAKHPACHGLFPRLREAARREGAPIEQEIEGLSDEVAGHPEVLGELISLRHYISDVLTETGNAWLTLSAGVTNYAALLRVIRHWTDDHDEQVALVTFNYDTILDAACRSILSLDLYNFDRGPLPGFIDHPKYKLLKLHGSVDWLHLADDVGGALRSLRRNAPGVPPSPSESDSSDPYALTWTDTFRTIYGQIPAPERMDSGYFSVIAVPTVTKNNFECPQAHLDVLKAAIPEVTRLLIIGWHGTEQHFLELWGKPEAPGRIPRIQIVDGRGSEENPGERAQAVERNLFDAGLQGDAVRLYVNGFSGFVAEGALAVFLSG
jgi:hypothetical protein